MFYVKKTVYVKSPNSRVYKKTDKKPYRYFDKTFREVCDDQFNFFEKNSRNKLEVTYSNFGSKRTAIRTLPNGGKIKTVIEEVYANK
ncbi:MAG: hypothetical protein E7177_07775 [Erysipelotrichaceae bacterium]|nr:hypothetical protein [Erysipelotrichaceae bacterium]